MYINKPSVILSFCLVAIVGCTNKNEAPEFIASDSLQPYMQNDFAQYQLQTRQWLNQHRVFMTLDHEAEINAVAPFELIPSKPNGQGILLVHGLGDSPYSYHDIAPLLAEKGFVVRVVLLPGHGTRAADLSLPTIEDWQQFVTHQYDLLNKKVDGVWLGGFSTGANLVTALAYQQSEVKGLLLFSPAFKPRNSLARFSPIASWFVDWESKVKEDNYTRYNSLPMKGAATYYKTSKAVSEDIEAENFTKPTFMMLSEADETIDSQYAVKAFTEHFTNTNNSLLWFGETQFNDPRITDFTMELPKQKIISASHISLAFSPNNPIYSRNGEIRLCFNEQPQNAPQDCRKAASDKIWFGAYGSGNEEMIRARITWNPYFAQSMQHMTQFLEKNL
ncbi:esterase [Vibrio sp. UCD-FRSSP16_10]|uniref:alpha/beta hydrolase n=1 Tax=unclassified Vibrio TaxID=2614977 RepID=UPI000802466E|nr:MULTISPECIES: alpha/beta fold hydrolase [unclassified Vibrio]OBT12130.1 esterase [Vibrio sp. UCD-FRSSP16_30]OBT20461.1 esterase [Vibrio sp. UCD-FRSSP16_10]